MKPKEEKGLKNLIIIGSFLRLKKLMKNRINELELSITRLTTLWNSLYGLKGFTWIFHQVIIYIMYL